MTTYTLNKHKNIYIEAWYENTRYGFRHQARLYENGWELAYAKACYYNRTWEQYDYQSVMHAAIDKAGLSRGAYYKRKLDDLALGRVRHDLRGLAAIGQMAELLGADPAAALEAATGGAIQRPDDWAALPAVERKRRTDAAITELGAA